MDILTALGINHSLGIQFCVFLFAYFAMTKLVFEPYFKAYKQRYQDTVGSESYISKVATDTEQLKQEFEIKAREINDKLKIIYDENRAKSAIEREKIMIRSKKESQDFINKFRAKTEADVSRVRSQLKEEIPLIVESITIKLLGKV